MEYSKQREEASSRLSSFEYSNSKEFLAEPDVFEYNQKVGKPVFDLIIGCNSMEKLGIVMDFKAKMITIDEIILPMRNIKNLTISLRHKKPGQ
jgi:hypothetical protein